MKDALKRQYISESQFSPWFLSSKVEGRLSSPLASTVYSLLSTVLALARAFRGQGNASELMGSRMVVHGQIFLFSWLWPAVCLISSTVTCIEMELDLQLNAPCSVRQPLIPLINLGVRKQGCQAWYAPKVHAASFLSEMNAEQKLALPRLQRSDAKCTLYSTIATRQVWTLFPK